tara:strand:- start:13138 stop:14265 length:1128 start_codon:yes stop_codon:yes gene_type:complete
MNKQVGGILSQAKTKIKKEGKKKIKQKVLEQLPSKDELKEKLISGACSLAAQEKMKKIYNKIHGLISKLENILLRAKEKVQAIKAKLQKIVDKVLPGIILLAEIIAILVLVMKILVALAPALLSMCGPPMAVIGPCISQMSKMLIKAAGFIGISEGTINAVTSSIKKYMKIALTIIGAVAAVMLLINPVLLFVQKIKSFIEFLYLMYIQMCNVPDESVMDEDGNINEALLEEEILKKDPTGLALSNDDLGTTGLAGIPLLGLGNASGVNENTNTNTGILTGAGNTNYGLGGDDGLGGYGNTGIMATSGTYGQHTGLGNSTRPNNDLHGITKKMTSLYEDLIIELRGKGKMEIVEHLTALDFGFQTRFERKIVPIS